MLRNRILLSLVFLLIVGFFILNTPEKGFAGLTPLPPGVDSDCCFAHEGTGCEDRQCTSDVCAVDAFCCNSSWDGKCAARALELCNVCQAPVVETNIPTLSEWGLIAMAGILGIVGFIVMRRRKVTA